MDLLNQLAALNVDASDRRAIVLAGVTGDGKSSTGNTLSGRAAFAVSSGLASATQECAPSDYMHDDEAYRVVDTIGMHDTGLSAADVSERFRRFSEHTPLGIDAFLFVVRWGRFKPEHEAALDTFARNCGESALRHTLLCFTHCDELDDAAVQRALADEAPASLRAWVARCAGAIGVCNLEGPRRDAARAALHAAVEAVRRANDGRRYTNEALDEARAKHAAAEEAERQAFASLVADFRKGSGPVVIEREREAVK